MRFFTREWCNDDLPDEEGDPIPERYAEHLRALRDRLPPRVRSFAEEINLHDGLVREVALDKEAHTLRVRIRAGDQQVGYYDAELLYLDVAAEPRTIQTLEKMRRDSRYELLYDELDADDSTLLVHRLMFWPEDEVAIRFRDLSWRRTPKQGRSDEGAV